MEVFDLANALFTSVTGSKEQQLASNIKQALNALRNNSKGEALSIIRRADKIVQEHNFVDWEAEMHAVWTVFYYHMKEEQDMLLAIRKAQKLEPNNARIEALRQVILKEK